MPMLPHAVPAGPVVPRPRPDDGRRRARLRLTLAGSVLLHLLVLAFLLLRPSEPPPIEVQS